PAGPERSPCEIAPDVSRKDCEPGPRTGLPGDETRDPAIRAASAARAREHSILAGKGAARIVFDAASARDDAASLVALTLDAGSEMPRHLHDGSSEYLLLLEGSGILVIGEEQIPVAAGDAIQIPSGIEHGFRAAAGGPLKALEFFAPAGPEQRFKDQKR
ncbi:MAG TPA: cupin domain-containing protein, partial [Candidatus Acidoferrum sp.]|nr:cupin domain-containing protein [Candidatus Acidoferrum sp.]